MPSHDVRISVEHYSNGGFGVIGENFSEMGLIDLVEVAKAVREILLMELGVLKLKGEK